MNLGGARIALETTGGKVRAECTQFGSIKGQLKALPAPFEHQFTAASLGKQCSENEGEKSACQDDGLRRKYTVCKRDAWISKMPNAEGYRPDDG